MFNRFRICALSSRLACASISDRSNPQRAAIETTVVEVKMIIRFRIVWKSLYPLCRPVICNCIVFLLSSQQQEQDPTNLYIANLPLTFKENDVEALLAQYGQVISTRILRDTSGQSKGVGFARFLLFLSSFYIYKLLSQYHATINLRISSPRNRRHTFMEKSRIVCLLYEISILY